MADRMHGGVKAGSTSVEIPIGPIRKTSDSTEQTAIASGSVTAYYRRQGGNATSITVVALTNLNDAYSSGGWKEYDATNMPGVYRLDVPNAAFATGADFVVVTVKVANCFVERIIIPLESAGASEVKTVVDAIKAKTDNLPSGPSRGVAFPLVFGLKLASNPANPATGLSPSIQTYKISSAGVVTTGGAYTGTEIGTTGSYVAAISSGDMNDFAILFLITGTDALPISVIVYTEPA